MIVGIATFLGVVECSIAELRALLWSHARQVRSLRPPARPRVFWIGSCLLDRNGTSG
ncbi:hypothetical protein HMPREF1980_02093 [Actinomyces sp. oral taxon 172 str. F0311]|nr:hypothetical protein HMPREF1980_02093 [Actinomyces sp. oral taxon 172 str. F0311]